jgi:hypothetical protein
MASVVFSKQHTGIYWSVGILVGILSTKEFGRNSFRFGGKPFFPQNGCLAPENGGHDPPFKEKGVPDKKTIPKCTHRVFLRYRFGKYQEIPTKYRPKLPVYNSTSSGGCYLWFVSANLLPYSYNIECNLMDLIVRSYF